MKKRAAIALCSALGVSLAVTPLAGRLVQAETTTTQEASDTADTEDAGSTQETSDTADTEDAGSAQETESSGAENAEGIEESTDYFTLQLPSEWEDHYVREEGNTIAGIPAVSFYEKTAHDNGEGGLIFTIFLTTDRQDYLPLPSYTFLGELTADDGTVYAVIAEFPSDVQFAIEAREQYEQMSAEVPSILASLQPADGMTFHAGQTRLEQSAERSYAFAQILEQFRNAGALPNGTMIDITTGNAWTNTCAILDVDGDGADELVMKIGGKAVSDKISAAAAQSDQAGTDAQAEEAATADTADGEAVEEDAAGDSGLDTETGTAAAEEEGTGSTLFGFATGATQEEEDVDEAAEETVDAEAVPGTAEDAAADESATDGSVDDVAAGGAISEGAAEDAEADEEYFYDTIATSSYYIFRGDESDSHVAHLNEEGLEEELANAGMTYVSTAYDLDWQTISTAKINRLYHAAYIPVGTSPAHEDAARRHAYKEALNNILENNKLPDDTDAISYLDYTSEDMEENEIAIADVDADGTDELVIRLNNTGMDTMRELVYGYDASEDSLTLELAGVPGRVVYYDNGAVKREAQYSNNVPSTMWPYDLLIFNTETGTYESQGAVYAWDKDVMARQTGRTVDALGPGFDDAADQDGNGRIYFLNDGTVGENAQEMDDADVDAWTLNIIPSGTGETEVYWYTLTQENIDSLLAK